MVGYDPQGLDPLTFGVHYPGHVQHPTVNTLVSIKNAQGLIYAGSRANWPHYKQSQLKCPFPWGLGTIHLSILAVGMDLENQFPDPC